MLALFVSLEKIEKLTKKILPWTVWNQFLEVLGEKSFAIMIKFDHRQNYKSLNELFDQIIFSKFRQREREREKLFSFLMFNLICLL